MELDRKISEFPLPATSFQSFTLEHIRETRVYFLFIYFRLV
jgi:hypothetical protein